MRRRLRQAGQVAGHVSHHGARLAGTLVLVALLLLGTAAWRLGQGPVDLPPLAARIGAAVSAAEPGLTVTVGRAGLAWEGFRRGGAPIDLRLADIAIRNRSGVVAARISTLRVTLSLAALIKGAIAPIRIIAHDPAIVFRPALQAAGGLAAPPEAVGDLLALISQSPRTGLLDLSALRVIRIADAHVAIEPVGALPGLVATDGALVFTRRPGGRMGGSASADFRSGAEVIPLDLTIAGDAGTGRVTALLGPFDPARLMKPGSPFTAVDLPVMLAASWPVGRFTTPELGLGVSAGGGGIAAGTGQVPIAGLQAHAVATRDEVSLSDARIDLAGPEGVAGPAVRLRGRIALRGALPAAVDATVSRVPAADLPRYWPAGLLRDARRYVIRHIKAGVARDGRFHAVFDLATGKLAPGAVTGGFTASGVTLDWFPGAPAMTGLAGRLHFTADDALDIDATAGRLGGLALRGHMRITTLSRHDQTATIDAHAAGGLADALGLLRKPPLRLKTTALKLDRTTGRMAATIHASVPLKRRLALADIAIRANAGLTGVHLPLPFAGLALDGGSAAIDVDPHHLALHGNGRVAATATRFTAAMKLPGGPLTLDAKADATRQALARLGLPVAAWRAGAAPLTVTYRDQAGGVLAVGADLTGVTLAEPAFGWRKAAGQPGRATLRIGLGGGAFGGLQAAHVEAPELLFDGARRAGRFVIAAARLGRLRARGSVAPPARPGAAWRISLSGGTLDLSALIAQARAQAGTAATAPRPASGPAWALNGTFSQLRLHAAPAPLLGATQVAATGDGDRLARLEATLAQASQPPARLTYRRSGGVTRIRLDAPDAGALLAATGATGGVNGGTLALDATRQGGLTKGRLDIDDFRLTEAPVMAKVLQALTIYGMPAATSGPGLAFTRLVAPFTISRQVVTLGGARAWSPSLGFTTTGQVDLARKRYDLSGTIVPAYALNTLPGRIPLIGRLFSPEKGGGLFAARYTVAGPFGSPRVMVNPVSALAPGFIRDLFGIGPPEPKSKP